MSEESINERVMIDYCRFTLLNFQNNTKVNGYCIINVQGWPKVSVQTLTSIAQSLSAQLK